MYRIDKRASIFKYAHVDPVAGREHLSLRSRAGTFQIGNARLLFRIEHDPSGIFAYGNDARREGRLTRLTMHSLWIGPARCALTQRPPRRCRHVWLRHWSAKACASHSAPRSAQPRTYALIEGPQTVDPAQMQSRVPDAHWYSEAIIALEIEPVPADALPVLVEALCGDGAPAGILDCEAADGRAIVEILPSVTQAGLVIRIADVELRRFNAATGARNLSPLPRPDWPRSPRRATGARDRAGAGAGSAVGSGRCGITSCNTSVSRIVDILATSILIYYLLLLIRGTRAVQILTGVSCSSRCWASQTCFICWCWERFCN